MSWIFGRKKKKVVEREDDFLVRVFEALKEYMEKIDNFKYLERVSNLISMFQSLSRMRDGIDKRYPGSKDQDEPDIDFERFPDDPDDVNTVELRMWVEHNIERVTLKIHEIIQNENDMLGDLERKGSESDNFFFDWTIRAKDIKDTILWIISEHSLNRYQYGPLSGVRESLEELLSKYDEIRKNVLLDDNLLGSELEKFLKELNQERGGQTIILDNIIGIKSVPELNEICTKKSTLLQIGEVCRFLTFEFHIVVTTTTGIILVFRNTEDRSLEHVLNIHERKKLGKVRVIRTVDICENHLLVCYQKPYDDDQEDFFAKEGAEGTNKKDGDDDDDDDESSSSSSSSDDEDGEDLIVVWNLDSGVMDYQNLSVKCQFCFFFNDKYSIIVFHDKMKASYYYISDLKFSISKWNEITMDPELKHFQDFIRVDKIDINDESLRSLRFDEDEEDEGEEEEEGEENKDLKKYLDETKTSQHRNHLLFAVRTRKEFGILDFGYHGYKRLQTYFGSRTNLRMNLVTFVQSHQASDENQDYIRLERPKGCSKYLCFFDVINVTSYLNTDTVTLIKQKHTSEGGAAKEESFDHHHTMTGSSDKESEVIRRRMLNRPRDQVLRFVVAWGTNIQFMTLCWKSKMEIVHSVYHPKDMSIFSSEEESSAAGKGSDVVVKKKKLSEKKKKKLVPREFINASHYQVIVEPQFHLKGDCVCGLFWFSPTHGVVWEKAEQEIQAGLLQYPKNFDPRSREFMILPQQSVEGEDDDDGDDDDNDSDNDDSDDDSDDSDTDTEAKKLMEEKKKMHLKKTQLDPCFQHFELPFNIPPLYIRNQKAIFFQRSTTSSSSSKKKKLPTTTFVNKTSSSSSKDKDGGGEGGPQGKVVSFEQLMVEGPSIFRQLFLLAWEERMENLRRGIASHDQKGVFKLSNIGRGQQEIDFRSQTDKKIMIYSCYKLGERILTGEEHVLVGDSEFDMISSRNEGDDQGGIIRHFVHPKIKESVTNYLCHLREQEFGKFGEGDELMKELHGSFRFCVAYDRVDFFFRKLFNLCIDACQPDRKQEYFDEVLLLIRGNDKIKRLPHEFIKRFFPNDYIGETESSKRKKGQRGGIGLIEDNDEGESDDEDDGIMNDNNEETTGNIKSSLYDPQQQQHIKRRSTILEVLDKKREQFTEMDIRTIRRIVKLSESIDLFDLQVMYQVELYERDPSGVDMVSFIYKYIQKVDRKREKIENLLAEEKRIQKEILNRPSEEIIQFEDDDDNSDDDDDSDSEEDEGEKESHVQKRMKTGWLYSQSKEFDEDVETLKRAREMFVKFLEVDDRAICSSRDVFNYLVNNIYTISKKLGFDMEIKGREQQKEGEEMKDSEYIGRSTVGEREFHTAKIYDWILNYMVEVSFDKRKVEDVIDRLRNVLKTELSKYTPKKQMKMIEKEKIRRQKKIDLENGGGGEVVNALDLEDDDVDPEGLLFLATAATEEPRRKNLENEDVKNDRVYRICVYEYYKFVVKIYTVTLPKFGVKNLDQGQSSSSSSSKKSSKSGHKRKKEGEGGNGGGEKSMMKGEGASGNGKGKKGDEASADDDERKKLDQIKQMMLWTERSNVHNRVPKLSEKHQETILMGAFNYGEIERKKYHNLSYMCVHCIIHLSEVNRMKEESYINMQEEEKKKEEEEEEEDEGESESDTDEDKGGEGKDDDDDSESSDDEEKEKKKKKKKNDSEISDVKIRLDRTVELIDQFLQFLTTKDPTALPQEALTDLNSKADSMQLTGLKRIIAYRLKGQIRSQRLKFMIRRFGAQPNKGNFDEMKELLDAFLEEEDLRIFYDTLFEMFDEAGTDDHRKFIGLFINEFLTKIIKFCRNECREKKGKRLEDEMMDRRLVMNEKFHENFVKVLVEHWVQIQRKYVDEDPPEKSKGKEINGQSLIMLKHWDTTVEYYDELDKKMTERLEDRAREEQEAKRRRPGLPLVGKGGKGGKDDGLDDDFAKDRENSHSYIQKMTWNYIRYLKDKADPETGGSKKDEERLISVIKNLRFCMIRYEQREIEEKITRYFREIDFDFKLERMLRVCGMIPRVRMLLFSRFLEYESTADEITRYLDSLLEVLLRELNYIHPPKPQVDREWKDVHNCSMSILYRNLILKKVNEILRKPYDQYINKFMEEAEEEADQDDDTLSVLSGAASVGGMGGPGSTSRKNIRTLNRLLGDSISRENKFYDVEHDESVYPKLRMKNYQNFRQFMEEKPVKDTLAFPQKDFKPLEHKKLFAEGYPSKKLVTFYKCIEYEWEKDIVEHILSLKLKPEEEQLDKERQRGMWEDCLRDGIVKKLIEMREGFGMVQDDDKKNDQISRLFASPFDLMKNKNEDDDYGEEGSSLLAFVGVVAEADKNKSGSKKSMKVLKETKMIEKRKKDKEVYNPNLVKIEEDPVTEMTDLFKKLGENTVKDRFKKEKEVLNRKIKVYTERMRQANEVLKEIEENRKSKSKGPKPPEHLQGRPGSSLSQREKAELDFYMMEDDSDEEDDEEEEEIRKDIVRYEEQIDRLFKKLRVITSKEERIKKNDMNPLNKNSQKYRSIENKGVNLLLQTYVYKLLSIAIQFAVGGEMQDEIPIPKIMSFLLKQFQGKHFGQVKDLVQKFMLLYEFENLCVRESSQLLALDRYKQMRHHVFDMKRGHRTEKGPFKCDVDKDDCLYETNKLEPNPRIYIILFTKCGHTYHRKCLLKSMGGKVICKKCKDKDDDD